MPRRDVQVAEQSAAVQRPYWSMALRALREARGITQEGWASRLGIARSTLQRWERGEIAPNAEVEETLLALCQQMRLFRAFDQGPLSGINVTPDWLQGLLVNARMRSAVENESALASQVAIGAEPTISGASKAPPPAGPPSNLQTPLTDLIGRQYERTEALRLLNTSRLLTLVGAGGVGKTRLALDVAAAMLRNRKDGVFFVALGPVTNPTMVLATIASVLGLNVRGERPVLDLLIEYLRYKETLLVLDNFEHIVTAAPQIVDMCIYCPLLKVLVTSRTRLRVRGERELLVPPLSVPDPLNLPEFETIAQYPAIALLVERSQEIAPEFAITAENAAIIAEICYKLDGLPLAIELAAAHARILSPKELLDRLNQRFTVLTNGPRDLPQRQQTIEDTIDWSYELLGVDQKGLFRRLSVFAGGCTLDAAKAVCDANGDIGVDIVEGMASLLDQSLLRRETPTGAAPRFLMLETVREYAARLLEESGEAASLRATQLKFLRRMAQTAFNEFDGPKQFAWLQRFELELANFRAALTWALSTDGILQDGQVLAASLSYFWFHRHLREGRDWLERLLARDGDSGTRARAVALLAAAQLALYSGGHRAAHPLLEECVTLSRSLQLAECLARALGMLGHVLAFRGDDVAAQTAANESVEIARGIGQASLLAYSLHWHGCVALWLDDVVTARASLEEGLVLQRSSGDRWLSAAHLGRLGDVAYREGDYATARRCCVESIDLWKGEGQSAGAAQSLATLARVALSEHRLDEAMEHIVESIRLSTETGSRVELPWTLAVLAAMCLAQGRRVDAARLFGTVESLGELIGIPAGAIYRGEWANSIAALRRGADVAAIAEAWAAGRAIGLEQAFTRALEEAARG